MNTTSGSEGDDPLQEARAYNQSIYLMVAMPYGLLGIISFLVYRGYRIARKSHMTIPGGATGATDGPGPI